MLAILGGMGPKATARLYLSLTKRLSTQASGDLSPELVIFSVAMPRRIEDALIAGDVGPRSPMLAEIRAMLDDAVERLIRAGGDLVAMPCNTLQTELGSICKARGIEQLDMVDATVEAIVDSGVQQVMVLGTTTTCRADLYGQRLRRHGVTCLYPDAREQALVEARIRSALDLRPHQHSGLTSLVQGRSYEGIVLACTDLAGDVVESSELPVFDSLECLASAAMRRISPDWVSTR